MVDHWIIQSRDGTYDSSPWLSTRWHLDRTGEGLFGEDWQDLQDGYDTADRAAAQARMEVLAARFTRRAWRVTAYVIAPTDSHPGTTAADAERIVGEAADARRSHRLTPAMERMLEDARELGVCGGDRRTEPALIARGLAEPVIGTTERRARGQAPGRTTTVYDAYLGARLTAEGRRVAGALALAAQLAAEIREHGQVRS